VELSDCAKTIYGYHCGRAVIFGQPPPALLRRLSRLMSKYDDAYIAISDFGVIISIKVQRRGIRAGAYVKSEAQAAIVAAILSKYCRPVKWQTRGSTAVEARCSGLWKIFEDYGLKLVALQTSTPRAI